MEGDLSGSWAGLDPNRVTILAWRDLGTASTEGRGSLEHFRDLGFQIVIAGFYDLDVQDNASAWATASEGIQAVEGSMYTTWQRDFSQIDEFGNAWNW